MEVRIAWTPIVAFLVVFCCLATEVSEAAPDNTPLNNCHPPSIRTYTKTSKVYYLLNGSVPLPCIARGDNLNYTWYKDDKLLLLTKDIFTSPGVGDLQIKKAKVTTAGRYQCRVHNHCGISYSPSVDLIRAHLPPFPAVEKPTVIQNILGGSAKLTCRATMSVPRATINWVLIDSSGQLTYDEDNPDAGGKQNPVKLDKRVTKDYDGNLYITSLRKEDEQDGKTYVCEATNALTRSSAKGEDKVIITKGKITNMGVMMMWHSKTDNLVLQGKRARFKCIFSGEPEPVYTWTRLKGGVLDDKRMKVNHYELTIDKAQYGDGGDYMCSGRNSQSTKSVNHTFHLEVKASPQWRVTPRNVAAGEEENASFECDAVGNPEPSVQWFVNGKPYSKDTSKGILNGNTLLFENLEKDDSQVIQCNASNIYGYIWADVFLFVQSLPPEILEEPQDNLIVAQNSNVTLKCEVTGKPKPKVVWYKGAQTLREKKYVIRDTGSLFIMKTEIANTGVYRCLATNRHGEAEAYGEITVRRQTEIVEPPVSQKVDYNNKVTFTCGAQTDENETLRTRWLKDKKPLDVTDKRIKVDQGVLTISDTKSKDTGDYLCVAENGLDNATAKATLEVKAPPDPPYDVTMQQCMGKGVTVTWKFDDSMRNFNKMVGFIVETMNEYSPGIWNKAMSLSYPADTASFQLSPYAVYWFRVIAVNKMGKGEPSIVARKNCTTLQAAPEKNPENVRTDEALTGFLVIKWKALRKIDLNGKDFHYDLEIKDISTGKVTKTSINDSKTQEYSMPVKTVYSPYLITVRSRNAAGACATPPQRVGGHSGEGKPRVSVNDFEVDPDINVTATMAGFRWSPVDDSVDAIQGKFQGYKIRFWKKGEKDTSMHNEIIPGTARDLRRKRDIDDDGYVRGRVMNLPSFSDIIADVVVINTNRMSLGSNQVNLSTPEGVPGPVEYLEALSRGINHIKLFWQPPPHPNGLLTGYKLSFRKIDSLDFGDISVLSDSIDPQARRYTITNLDEDSQYRVFITAATSKGWGKEYFIDVVTASRHMVLVPGLNGEELAPPKIQKVLAMDNEANVSWSLDMTEEGTRIGYTYNLQYRKKGDNNWKTSHDSIEDRQWANLDHLDPGTTYHVRVIAMDGKDGKQKHSEEHMFRTSGVATKLRKPRIEIKVRRGTRRTVRKTFTTSLPLTDTALSASAATTFPSEKVQDVSSKMTTAHNVPAMTLNTTGLEMDVAGNGSSGVVKDNDVKSGGGGGEKGKIGVKEQLTGKKGDEKEDEEELEYTLAGAVLNSNGANSETGEAVKAKGAARGSFLSAAWFIGMMIAIAILILILIIVCIIKRNRGDNYPVQEKERLRGNCDDNHDQFNGFGKGSDENGIGVSSSFDRDGEKVPLDADGDSMDYGDDDAGPFNEDGSFIGQYGRGDKSNDMANVSASSNV